MPDLEAYGVRIFTRPTYDVLIASDRLGTMLLGQSITWTFEISRRRDGAPFDPAAMRLCLLRPNLQPGGETVYPVSFVEGDPVVTTDDVLIAFFRTEGFTAGSFSAEVVPPMVAASEGTWRVWLEGDDGDGHTVLAEESFVRVQPGRVRLPA